ncbi:hypothetical protein VP01_148g6 [Puccinia sorghi]|uniref:Uncharacterized protein n=1 Tax=Puccinia sorghi TaxID=27349 RepID=A0A0L6VJJ1_9BASI|nr:hypothetical protein VP01_148g6 [Puccinia sorghi]
MLTVIHLLVLLQAIASGTSILVSQVSLIFLDKYTRKKGINPHEIYTWIASSSTPLLNYTGSGILGSVCHQGAGLVNACSTSRPQMYHSMLTNLFVCIKSHTIPYYGVGAALKKRPDPGRSVQKHPLPKVSDTAPNRPSARHFTAFLILPRLQSKPWPHCHLLTQLFCCRKHKPSNHEKLTTLYSHKSKSLTIMGRRNQCCREQKKIICIAVQTEPREDVSSSESNIELVETILGQAGPISHTAWKQCLACALIDHQLTCNQIPPRPQCQRCFAYRQLPLQSRFFFLFPQTHNRSGLLVLLASSSCVVLLTHSWFFSKTPSAPLVSIGYEPRVLTLWAFTAWKQKILGHCQQLGLKNFLTSYTLPADPVAQETYEANRSKNSQHSTFLHGNNQLKPSCHRGKRRKPSQTVEAPNKPLQGKSLWQPHQGLK